MSIEAENSALAATAAERILAAFRTFQGSFTAITARAQSRFERREWHAIQTDAQQRLDVYTTVLSRLLLELRESLGARLESQALWRQMKQAYSPLLDGEPNFELAQTFFNSVTRRIFTTVGVNPDIEFASTRSALRELRSPPDIYRRYGAEAVTPELVRRILEDFRFTVGYCNLERDARLVARRAEEELRDHFADGRISAVECLKGLFFRNKGAYIIGRVRKGIHVVPFVLPLLNNEDGIVVDALLMNQNEVSIVFSFTRSYFLVQAECPRQLIVFLKSIMPLKPIAELYLGLGFSKHGKTELYRSLIRHLAKHDDRFIVAPGDPGMVMLVFTLPGFDVVFKVIRDEFPPPKQSTRRDVMDRYRLVFKHDRVGRLIDAQEFEHLEFDRDRFAEDLLEQLLQHAGRTVALHGDGVDIKHLYAERRVTPFNLYLRRAGERAARAAVIDYGNAIKELAAANIFPGDFLLKNFGVTRHGRVVFYDYDELCLLDECRFRRMPVARNPEDDMAPEPWFTVGENDVFPEEFRRFLGLTGALRETFERHHRDLFDADYWRQLQERHRVGELLDVFPYPERRRLRPGLE